MKSADWSRAYHKLSNKSSDHILANHGHGETQITHMQTDVGYLVPKKGMILTRRYLIYVGGNFGETQSWLMKIEGFFHVLTHDRRDTEN